MRALPQLHQDVFAEPKRQLTAKQQRFVSEYLANGGKQTAAAETAGYAKDSAANVAYHLLRKPLIQSAIVKETLTAIGLAAVPALATVVRLSEVAKSDYVKLEAARDLLDRAGFGKPERTSMQGDQNLTVSLNLSVQGGLEKHQVDSGDHPDTRNSSQKFDLPAEGGQEQLQTVADRGEAERGPPGAGGGGGFWCELGVFVAERLPIDWDLSDLIENQGGFSTTLSFSDRQKLRAIVRKVHLHYLPGHMATNRHCDALIDVLAPETVAYLIRRTHEGGSHG
jgi:phage terminase small subunit